MYSIDINEKNRSLSFNADGDIISLSFDELLSSKDWLERKVIRIDHNAVTMDGAKSFSTLDRSALTVKLLHSNEKSLRHDGVWEYAAQVHKLYGIFDGKSEAEMDREIENLSKQRDLLDTAMDKWKESVVVECMSLASEAESVLTTVSDVTQALIFQDSKDTPEDGKLDIETVDMLYENRDFLEGLANAKYAEQLEKSREPKPFLVSQEMKKMLFAARDQSKPKIKLSNVTPQMVKKEYGDSLKII